VLTRFSEFFPLVGVLKAFQEPLAAAKSCERMCNEMIANITGLDLEKKPDEGKVPSDYCIKYFM
jgi:E3 ubiquitin-protein ligase listerin